MTSGAASTRLDNEDESEKLRVAVRYAYEYIPFYRRKFDRSVMVILTKKDDSPRIEKECCNGK